MLFFAYVAQLHFTQQRSPQYAQVRRAVNLWGFYLTSWLLELKVGKKRGRLRAVINGQERMRKVAKHGVKHAIVPFANSLKEKLCKITVHGVKALAVTQEVVAGL